MNKAARIIGSAILGLIATLLILGVITWQAFPEDRLSRTIICTFPNYREMVRDVCKCKYNAPDGKTIDTSVGVGCNAIFFTDLVGTDVQACPI